MEARTSLERGELEVREQLEQLGVRGRLLELPVSLGGVELSGWVSQCVGSWQQVKMARQGRTEYSPVKPTALTIASATCLIETSSFSPTERMIGSISLYSLSCQMNSLARSRE